MFSKRETEILEIIGRKKVTVEYISIKLFDEKEFKPFDDLITVFNSIRRIIKKCEHHDLKWTLVKEKNKMNLTTIKRAVRNEH